MTVGKRIQMARKKANLTQKELAAKLGLATGTVQQYELDKREPRQKQLEKIAKVLEVDANWLQTGVDLEQVIMDFISSPGQWGERACTEEGIITLPAGFKAFGQYLNDMGIILSQNTTGCYFLEIEGVRTGITAIELNGLVSASKATVIALIKNIVNKETDTPEA